MILIQAQMRSSKTKQIQVFALFCGKQHFHSLMFSSSALFAGYFFFYEFLIKNSEFMNLP